VLHSARLNIASIIVVFRLEFTQEGVFLSHLRSLNVCLGVVSEEEVIVSGVCLNPLSELRVGYKSDITVGLVMTRFVSKEEFLEICVIKNVRVGSPSVVRALFVFSDKTDSVHAHEGDEFFRL
jgi:hypothetical protein